MAFSTVELDGAGAESMAYATGVAPSAWGFIFGGKISFTDTSASRWWLELCPGAFNASSAVVIQCHGGKFRFHAKANGGTNQYSTAIGKPWTHTDPASQDPFSDGETYAVYLWAKAHNDWRLFVDAHEVLTFAPTDMDAVTMSTELDTFILHCRFYNGADHLQARSQDIVLIDAVAEHDAWPIICALSGNGKVSEQKWFSNEGIAHWRMPDSSGAVLDDYLGSNDLSVGIGSDPDPVNVADIETTEWSRDVPPVSGFFATQYDGSIDGTLGVRQGRGFDLPEQILKGTRYYTPRTKSLADRIGMVPYYAMTMNIPNGSDWAVNRPSGHPTIPDPGSAGCDPANFRGPWRLEDNPGYGSTGPGAVGTTTWSGQPKAWNGRICEISVIERCFDIAWAMEQRGYDWQNDPIYIMLDTEREWEHAQYSPLHPYRANDIDPKDGASDGDVVNVGSVGVAFAGKTMTRAAAPWDHTPSDGEWIQVTGSVSNDGWHQVDGTPTSTAIDVVDTLVTEGSVKTTIYHPVSYAFAGVTAELMHARRVRLVELVMRVLPKAIVGEYGTPQRRLVPQTIVNSTSESIWDPTVPAEVDDYMAQWIKNRAPSVAYGNAAWPNMYLHSEFETADGATLHSISGEVTIGSTVTKWQPAVTVGAGTTRGNVGDTFEEAQRAIAPIWARMNLDAVTHQRVMFVIRPVYAAKTYSAPIGDGTPSGYELIHPDRMRDWWQAVNTSVDGKTAHGFAYWRQFLWDLYKLGDNAAIEDRLEQVWGVTTATIDEARQSLVERWGVGAMQAVGYALNALRYDERTRRWRIRRGWRRRQRRTRNP